MSEVVKDQAKDLIKRYDESGFIHRDATRLLPELVAECERLQENNQHLQTMIDEAHGIMNETRIQLAFHANELARWQKGDAKLLGDLIYIEEESAKFAARFGKIAPEMQRIIDMLKRLQEAAGRMQE